MQWNWGMTLHLAKTAKSCCSPPESHTIYYLSVTRERNLVAGFFFCLIAKRLKVKVAPAHKDWCTADDKKCHFWKIPSYQLRLLVQCNRLDAAVMLFSTWWHPWEVLTSRCKASILPFYCHRLSNTQGHPGESQLLFQRVGRRHLEVASLSLGQRRWHPRSH